jgi:hypothetical protein
MNEFDPWDYAYEHFGETLNFMSEDEKSEIDSFYNSDDLDDYLRCFIERT